LVFDFRVYFVIIRYIWIKYSYIFDSSQNLYQLRKCFSMGYKTLPVTCTLQGHVKCNYFKPITSTAPKIQKKNRNWFDFNLVIKEILYHFVTFGKIDPFHETALFLIWQFSLLSISVWDSHFISFFTPTSPVKIRKHQFFIFHMLAQLNSNLTVLVEKK
jgi:hypothetical protein